LQPNADKYIQFIKQLKFSSIYVENIKAKRIPHIEFVEGAYTDFKIIKKGYEKISGNLWKVNTTLQFSAHTNKPRKNIIDITAKFIAIYESKIEFDDEIFDVFSSTNLMLNLWPYYRELFQSMTLRMGLPPYILPPLYLIPDKKSEEEKS
jgi:preprotein translocase subunit SecB